MKSSPIFIFCLLLSSFGFGQANLLDKQSDDIYLGHDKGNGGTILEAEIKNVSTHIQRFLKQGFHQKFKYTDKITVHDYKRSMSRIIHTKIKYVIADTKLGIEYAEKACINYYDEAKAVIRCNLDQVKSLSKFELIKLIHHELAGLANLETNNGVESDYFFTNQLKKEYFPLSILKDKNTYAYPMALQLTIRDNTQYYYYKAGLLREYFVIDFTNIYQQYYVRERILDKVNGSSIYRYDNTVLLTNDLFIASPNHCFMQSDYSLLCPTDIFTKENGEACKIIGISMNAVNSFSYVSREALINCSNPWEVPSLERIIIR